MAFAPFFDKAALSAAQILHNFELPRFMEELNSQTVTVQFDRTSLQTHEGQVATRLLLNLIARLYPRVCLRPVGHGTESGADALARQIKAINPEIEIVSSPLGRPICVVLGRSDVERSLATVIYAGSREWSAVVSTIAPIGFGDSMNPFGAAAAACLAAANVFRASFGHQLDAADLDRDTKLSVYDYSTSSDTGPTLSGSFGAVVLVGAGAIGGATIWTLSHAPQIKGTLRVIDDEHLELSNLQRYVLAHSSDAHERVLKTTLAERRCADTQLEIESYPASWGEYLAKTNNWNNELIAVAVDSAEDRCAVQASLPRSIVNGWTQTSDFGVSRHLDFLDSGACLMCLYLPSANAKSQDELVSEALSIPERRMEVRELLYTNNPVNAELLEIVASRFELEPQALAIFDGKPITNLYIEGVCGGLLPLKKNGRTTQLEVPLAFQSAMAGVFLASEIASVGAKLRKVSPGTVTRLNLLRRVTSFPNHRIQRSTSGRCICQDEDFRARYAAKWKSNL